MWWCALGINVGVETDGKHGNFERPVLVLMKFNKDAVLVVPLSSNAKRNPYYYPFLAQWQIIRRGLFANEADQHQATSSANISNEQRDLR